MAVTEVPARDFVFETNTGTTVSPIWVVVGGINKWSHSPNTNTADTRTFEDGGRERHWVASRGDEFSMTGLYQEDPDNGARDAGQEACEAWATEVGPDSIRQFRITSPGGTTQTFNASAEVKYGEGGNDDPNAWELKVTVDGAITTS